MSPEPLPAEVHWNGARLPVDLGAGTALAIVLDPHGRQPGFFAERPATAEPLRAGAFIGDVRDGGSCNVETVHWAPHCHGTHTECIGHLTAERRSVLECVDCRPVLARLVSLAGDPALTLKRLRRALAGSCGNTAALILRTLPNPPDKRWRNYSAQPDYPVLEPAAVRWLAGLPLRHLLLDTPSLDAPDDAQLTNHRTWWGLDPAIQRHGFTPERRSITELIYVPDDLGDGDWWLHLELAPLRGDAVPSRPVLYPVAPPARGELR